MRTFRGAAFGRGAILCVTAAFVAGAAVMADVSFERDGKTLKKFVINSGAGRIEIRRAGWANTVVVTAKGKRLNVTDPFMYNAVITPPGKERIGGYWNKPEHFDLWKIEQPTAPDKPGTDILTISSQQPGVPLLKEVAIAVAPKQAVACVYSRVTALENLSLDVDQELMWFAKSGLRRYVADGTVLTPKDKLQVGFRRWAMMYHKEKDASVGIVGVAVNQSSQYTDRFGVINFRVTPKTNSAEIVWVKRPQGALAKGETRSHRYLIVWGDGDLKDTIAALAAKAAAGQLDAAFHPLPDK